MKLGSNCHQIESSSYHWNWLAPFVADSPQPSWIVFFSLFSLNSGSSVTRSCLFSVDPHLFLEVTAFMLLLRVPAHGNIRGCGTCRIPIFDHTTGPVRVQKALKSSFKDKKSDTSHSFRFLAWFSYYVVLRDRLEVPAAFVSHRGQAGLCLRLAGIFWVDFGRAEEGWLGKSRRKSSREWRSAEGSSLRRSYL